MWTATNVNFMRRNCQHRGQALAMADYTQRNVALDHQMQRQLATESLEMEPQEEDGGFLAFGGGGYGNGAVAPSASARKGAVKSKKGKSRGKKKKERKSKRNDVFSSHMYSMEPSNPKRESHGERRKKRGRA